MDDPNAKDWENQWYGSGGGAGVMVSTVLDPSLRKWEGKNLVEIGKEMGKDPRDAAMDLVIADRGESSRDHLDHAGRRCRLALAQSDDFDRHRFRARAPKTGRSPNRSRIRARGDRSRACSASTCATKS